MSQASSLVPFLAHVQKLDNSLALIYYIQDHCIECRIMSLSLISNEFRLMNTHSCNETEIGLLQLGSQRIQLLKGSKGGYWGEIN